MIKTITVPSGIGDNIWILQKLINANEQFKFILPGNNPRRGKQIFDLLPQIGTAEYGANMPFAQIKRSNRQLLLKNWAQYHGQQSFILEANTHLEAGRRIEEWLPDLPTSFRFEWQTSEEDKDNADVICSDIEFNKVNDKMQSVSVVRKNCIGIYASAYSTQRAWGFWNEQQWLELIKLCSKDYTYVIIGAEWDTDLGTNLIRSLSRLGYKYVNTIGQSLGTVIEIMKRLHYFFSFPSGLGILATTVDCPVTMFYPSGKNGAPDLRPMINAWALPEAIEIGRYKGAAFCTPEQIYKWCKENKWV